MSPLAQRLPLSAAAMMLLGASADPACAAGISPTALASAMAGAGSLLRGFLAAGTDTVTSCADDGAAGTLRSVIGSAVTGDTIDMTGLPGANANCAAGVITLTMGVISTTNDLILSGPGPDVLAISAPAGGGRVLFSSADSQLEIDDLTVRGGRALMAGGCIYSKGSVTLAHSMLTDCQANYGGGAVAAGGGVLAATVTIKDGSLVTGNTATFLHNNKYAGAGGGIAAVNAFICSDSTVSNNQANQAGGGIFSIGSVSLTRCTVEGNTARAFGGGIAQNPSDTQSSIVASTISGNSAMKGGGIYTQAEFYIVGSTIAFNSAANGDAAGIFSNAYLTLQSTIVARNISAGSTHADFQVLAMVGGGYNLVESSSVVDHGVIIVSSDPKLLPLADNGGPTRTHALDPTSPAIDAGNNPLSDLTDQRGAGFLREVPVAKPDIGAFEFRGDGIFLNGFE
jgi:hypothetical protein